MAGVKQALYVVGEQVGADWQFEGRVFVEDPAGSAAWRKATAGEVEVNLDFLGAWWQLPKELERKNTDAEGNVVFAGHWENGTYTMEAIHNVSKDMYRVKLDCHEDGTYDVTVEIE